MSNWSGDGGSSTFQELCKHLSGCQSDWHLGNGFTGAAEGVDQGGAQFAWGNDYALGIGFRVVDATFREGLRGIEACLHSRLSAAYRMGIRGRVTHTNLAYANDHRD